MPHFFCRKHSLFCRKAISVFLIATFGLSMIVTPSGAQLLPNLPAAGQMVLLTSGFQPPVLKGMTVHPENPLLFDFIVDRGQDRITDDLLKDESTKLIKFFLTSMTIPDQDAWVNLSPYEKDRIIPDALGQTEMGRQMLEQDYMLKQLAASLTNPDTELGKQYWDEVRRLETLDARRSTLKNQHNISPPLVGGVRGGGDRQSIQSPSLVKEGVGGVLPTNNQLLNPNPQPPTTIFNKVWIVPDRATIVEKDGFAYITESKLNVLLGEDYTVSATEGSPFGATEGKQSSLNRIAASPEAARNDTTNDQRPTINDKSLTTNVQSVEPLTPNHQSPTPSISTQAFRKIILPKIIEEVNTGKNFAPTRQVYQSVILAAWYKKALKDSLLGRIYANKSKVAGVESDVKDIKQKVYDQYLEAFKKGAYNIIKEDVSPIGDDPIPRKYFSGGFGFEKFMSDGPTIDNSEKGVSVAASSIITNISNFQIVRAVGVESTGEEEAVAQGSAKTGEVDNVGSSAVIDGIKTGLSQTILATTLALTGGNFTDTYAQTPITSAAYIKPAINSQQIKELTHRFALSISELSNRNTRLAPSHYGHPGFENLKFTYDAAVDALILKAAGKQKEAETVLDYFAQKLDVSLSVLQSRSDTNRIYGILKIFEARDGINNVVGIINGLDINSRNPQGQGQLEYYTTPGPMAFVIFAFLNVNADKYLTPAKKLGETLLFMQAADGGVRDGDRSPNRVHTEPHMDAYAAFKMLYEKTKDSKWNTAADKAYQWFVKNVYHAQRGEIDQGFWENGPNKTFATDAYTWTMLGPAGDTLSLDNLAKLSATVLSKSLTRVTLELPDGQVKTVILVDFTDPRDPEIIKARGGFHPMGSVEWTGGMISALQKNAVRFWNAEDKKNREMAMRYKAIAIELIEHSYNAFYELPSLQGLLSFYATGQNVETGHGWRTPFFYTKGNVSVKGGSLVSGWPILSNEGLNPLVLGNSYLEAFNQIPYTEQTKQNAKMFIGLSVINRSFRETVPTEIPKDAPNIVEANAYNSNMWNAFNRGDYPQAIRWAQRVLSEQAWVNLAKRDQEIKAREAGGLIDYPWGLSPKSVPKAEAAIWRYPLLNEMGTAMWALAAANFELGNRAETKKWIARIIDEVPYHQIFAPDGPGYWNALVSWELNPGNIRRDELMGVLYREVLREKGIRTALPRSVSAENSRGQINSARTPVDSNKKIAPAPAKTQEITATGKNINPEKTTTIAFGTDGQWGDQIGYSTWKSGPFNLTGVESLRLTFSADQTGTKFLARILPPGAQPDTTVGLNTKIYTIPRSGVVTIPLREFPVNSLENISQISIHSGVSPWGRYPLGQSRDKEARPSKIETVKSASSSAVGGIDFDPSKLNLQIKRDGHGVPLPLPQQNLENINIDGLYPVIINILPINAQTLPILSQANINPDEAIAKINL